jgi:hypothetical protein
MSDSLGAESVERLKMLFFRIPPILFVLLPPLKAIQFHLFIEQSQPPRLFLLCIGCWAVAFVCRINAVELATFSGRYRSACRIKQ